MSLFPAYDVSGPSQSSEIEKIIQSRNDEQTWLNNSSFQQPEEIITPITIISDSSDCEIVEIAEKTPAFTLLASPGHSKKLKKSKLKHKVSSKRAQSRIKYEPVVEKIYFDDKIRDRGNFKVDTLCSRARPLYVSSNNNALGFVSHILKKKPPLKRRYFTLTTEQIKKSKKKHSKQLINDSLLDAQFIKINDKVDKEEEEIKLKIKQFNERLQQEPHHIDLWIEYINFADRDDNFEIGPHRSNTRVETVKYQRKLAITERALQENPASPVLLKLKLNFLNELSPADEYSSQLELLISKEPGNVILWQALITATRASIALCTVPRVMASYAKCFASLHLWSRASPQTYDNNLLKMLFQCLIFLRHAGLWEQMWEVLRMNLCLNLGVIKDSMTFKGSIVDEKKLIGMEEVILTCQLPLNQLWLRVELLRENCHWITVGKEELELIGDSHRFISPQDVTEFVHPLVSIASNFRLAIYALLALKIPLLPSRHVILEELRMDECNWAIDSIESLLPMLFPCVGEVAGHEPRIALLRGLIEGTITSGPQYLRFHPAQEGFLDFLRDVFKIIAEKLSLEEEKNQIYIWWMRFERCLVGVQRACPQAIKSDKSMKKLRGIIKEFLKKDENRNNLDFYREYAMIEREMGRWENCLNILETAIKNKGSVLLDIENIMEQASVLSLYTTLIESLLDTRTWNVNNKIRIMKVFGQMSSGPSEEVRIITTQQYLKDICEQFLDASDISDEGGLSKYFQPNFHYNAVMCYVYFLHIADRDLDEIYMLFDKCISRSSENAYLQELFCEGQIIFKQLVGEQHIIRKNDELLKSLDTALSKFPDNFYLLSVSCAIESELPNWCVGMSSGTSSRLWPAISLCLSGRCRLNSIVCRKDPSARTAALNKLLHFHKRLTKIPEIRCCPLVWRLLILLLREHNLCEKKGEETYHESVASCPWARCIYIDAAEIAPQLVTQIQDVIREKDLRMHVTPEELDILRG